MQWPRGAPALLLGASLLTVPGCGAPEAGRPGLSEYNLDASGLALHGYSPVSYVRDGVARAGSPDLTATWRGVTYRFHSADERSVFLRDPERFEPAYGGWCAYGTSVGIRWDVDPEDFEVVDGRLFLFSRNAEADARQLWDRENPKTLIARADRYWQAQISE